jgi:predicted extracellular nuclease
VLWNVPKELNRDEKMYRFMPTHNRWMMIILVLMLVSAAAVQMVSADTAHVANHVVISEFATRGSDSPYDEFVELYNPTSSAINIGGWKMQSKSAEGGSWTNRIGAAGLPEGTTIAAHSFYLLAANTYSGAVTPDYKHTAKWGLADNR